MRFSLILSIIERTDEIQCFLASLCAQTYREFEVIVVDQNPDDRLTPVLDSYADRFPITRLHTETKGASRGRNVGLEHASGDIVGFPDDDCQYPPDLLAAVARFFVSHPARDGLVGRATDANGKTVMGRFDTRPGPFNKTNAWRRGICFTIFLRRECAEKARFDEDLGPGAGTAWGAGEETDYLMRLLDRGASIYYDPKLVVIHSPAVPPYNDKAVRKAYAYGCGMGRVIRKHRMPLWFKAKYLVRPLGGAVLSLAGLNPGKAKFRWNTYRGRLRGLLGD